MSFGVFQNNNGQNARNATAPVSIDTEIPGAPDDSVSCLRFSPAACQNTLLLAASWDKTVRIWLINGDGTSSLVLSHATQAPILDACWNHDGSQAYICGVDNKAYRWDLSANTMTIIGEHAAPIRTIHYIQSPTVSYIMTGGWDKKLNFWNVSNNQCIASLDVSDRVYCADVHYPMAVVATGDRHASVFDLTDGPRLLKRFESPLKYQTRCINIYCNKANNIPEGFAIGSIEGRVGIHCINDNLNPKASFSFKCHRSLVTNTNTQDIYAVNNVVFHPSLMTLVTAGSDGKFSYWDKDARTKLKQFDGMGQPITASAIDAKGNIFAYAIGYDWSRGYEYNDIAQKSRIFIKPCFEDMKPQAKK